MTYDYQADPESQTVSRAMKAALGSAIALTTIICAASFVLSFTALWDLATRAGQPRNLAWLFPVVIDGTILQATISVVAIAGRLDRNSVRGRRFFWGVLVVSALTSICCNALHAFMSHASAFDPAIAAAIATAAPIGLLASTHGLAVLVRTPLAAAPARRAGHPVAAGAADFRGAVPAGEGLTFGEPDDADDADYLSPDPERAAEFASPTARIQHALRLYGQGCEVPDIAPRVDRSQSTVYRWIKEAAETGPLVPRASLAASCDPDHAMV